VDRTTGLIPRNGVGFNLDNDCNAAYHQVTVGNIFEYNNYTETNVGGGNVSGPCVATGFDTLNHFEVDLSRTEIQVFGTDAGTVGPPVLLASAPLSLPFSTGYVHYQVGIRAPAKYLNDFHLNAVYALYHWRNLGFDGPAARADRAYQVPDALTAGPNGGRNIGYKLVDGSNGTTQGMYTCCPDTKVAPITLHNVHLTDATSAQITFDAYSTVADQFDINTSTILYRLNGGPWVPMRDVNYKAMLNQNWSGSGTPSLQNWWMSIDEPIPLSALQQGDNTIEFTTQNFSVGYPVVLANTDLVVSTAGTPATPGATLTPGPSATATIPPTVSETPNMPTNTPTTTPPVTPTVTPTTGPTGTGTGCRFASAPPGDRPAFCDTFDMPMGTGNRSGDLNGVVWGVSRGTGGGDTYVEAEGAGVTSGGATADVCNEGLPIKPEHDLRICNGVSHETMNDGGAFSHLAMYPKQPFDIAGRTGTVVFDMSDDTEGTHAAWPEFWYTDTPSPEPVFEGPSANVTTKNAFAIRFSGDCVLPGGCGYPCPAAYNAPQGTQFMTAEGALTTRNYVTHDVDSGNPDFTFRTLNCVRSGSAATGLLNHVELRISQQEVDVYATDAGKTSPLVEIAQIVPNSSTPTSGLVPLTRGLIWLTDSHYNADKGGNHDQQTHTFLWDNVGFDGPVLPRDLSFDVLDRMQPDGLFYGFPEYYLGWYLPQPGLPPSYDVTVTTQPMTAANIAAASGALLTFNAYVWNMPTISYNLNGHGWHDVPWPFPDDDIFTSRTYAVPISLAEVQPGANTIQLKSSLGNTRAWNIDIKLLGAAGIVPPAAGQ
jgi:hypothetical protein